jgi:hypothetical protein
MDGGRRPASATLAVTITPTTRTAGTLHLGGAHRLAVQGGTRLTVPVPGASSSSGTGT